MTSSTYLQRGLKLSSGAAHSPASVAARLVQRFPEVVEPIRGGKLCFTTVGGAGPVMTEENRSDALPRFYDVSKQAGLERRRS